MDPNADPLRRRALPAVTGLTRAGRVAVDSLADATPSAVASTARVGAFWASIALPFLHVPLLLVAGFSESTTPTLVTLWTLHTFSLAVGAPHDPTR